MSPKKTIWQNLKSKGYSRRDFLKFCSTAAVIAGIEQSSYGKVVKALETKVRPPVIWLHFQECTCCSESFIRSSHPIVADVVLDLISLEYTETLQAASGHYAEKSMQDVIDKFPGKYILLVEGSVPTADDGIYCTIAGKSAMQIIKETSEKAAAVIAWGNCASNGCVQSANPNPTGATPIQDLVDKPVINVPGCPPIADVMTGIITHILVYGQSPKLDSQGRPKAFYGKRVHDTCYRRPFYDAGLFVETFDDDMARKGYCLYKMGCRGPLTYNACAVTKWNEGTSYPIQSGHGCIGCGEKGFWDNGPFYERLTNFPGFGVEATADSIGLAASAAVGVGVAAHAVSTNIRKRKLIKENMKESVKEGGEK